MGFRGLAHDLKLQRWCNTEKVSMKLQEDQSLDSVLESAVVVSWAGIDNAASNFFLASSRPGAARTAADSDAYQGRSCRGSCVREGSVIPRRVSARLTGAGLNVVGPHRFTFEDSTRTKENC